jgi:hypothetical protein
VRKKPESQRGGVRQPGARRRLDDALAGRLTVAHHELQPKARVDSRDGAFGSQVQIG